MDCPFANIIQTVHFRRFNNNNNNNKKNKKKKKKKKKECKILWDFELKWDETMQRRIPDKDDQKKWNSLNK